MTATIHQLDAYRPEAALPDLSDRDACLDWQAALLSREGISPSLFGLHPSYCSELERRMAALGSLAVLKASR